MPIIPIAKGVKEGDLVGATVGGRLVDGKLVGVKVGTFVGLEGAVDGAEEGPGGPHVGVPNEMQLL